jgi:hypothetical protein
MPMKASDAAIAAEGSAKEHMWIVKVALNRPYTFIVLALLILIAAPVVILRTPTDIFPEHQYSGRFDRLDIYRPQSRRTRRALDVAVREGTHHAGRQYPAYRVDDL